MPASEWIKLTATVGLPLIGLIVWLVRLESRVNDAHRRCDDLKKGLDALEDLDVRVARIETKLDGVADGLRDLNASIRWMRDPAAYEMSPPRGVTPPKWGG